MTIHGPAAGHEAPVPRGGMGFPGRAALVRLWLSILVAEAAIMAVATPFAIRLAAAQHYGTAATILISSTLIAGGLVFALWRKLQLVKMRKLAEDRRLAERRRREAEALARQKSKLLATMSHEIRTPLNGVIGMLGLMLETDLSAEQRNYTSIAQGSARSLLSFLDEILDTAKGEALAASRGGPLDLGPFIEGITELLAPRAHAKGIDLSALISPEVPRSASIDSQKLRQILFNLLGNAIKFTDRGGVEMLVSRGKDSDLEIRIRDTGIGMTDEELSRVFDDYAQANDDTARRFGGTGLGLAISKGVVESMGGALAVASEKDRGTCFTATFPGLLEPAAETPATPLLGRKYGLIMGKTIAGEHLRLNLEALGAAVEYLPVSPPSAKAQGLAGIIADAASAPAIVRRRLGNRKQAQTPLWILLAPEERRELRDLLAAPNTGYLVKPLRFSSLVARLIERDQDMVSAAARELRKASTDGKRRARLRVLLVDDTPVNLLLARTLLARGGHDVATATSGQGALEILMRGEKFDCVLLDIEMPGCDGHETARRLRVLENANNWPRTPVIALTANAAPEDRASCLASGMDWHLAKPFDQHDLLEALAHITRRRAA